MRLERRAGPVLRDLQPHTPNSSEQRWDARSIWTVNEGDSLEHQYIPAKGTTANSVSPFILLLAKCHHLFPTWVCSQIFWILKIIFIRRRNWKLMFIFSVPSPFFTDVQRVHWAQGGSCYQGQLLFAPNSKWNFLCCPPKLLLVSTSLCVVWHASCQPVPPLHLLLCCLHSSVTQQTHSHHRCPLCVQAGSGTRHQLQSSSSPGCAPCLLSPAVTTTDPGAYIRKQNCLYSDPEGQTGSFIVIQSKPG